MIGTAKKVAIPSFHEGNFIDEGQLILFERMLDEGSLGFCIGSILGVRLLTLQKEQTLPVGRGFHVFGREWKKSLKRYVCYSFERKEIK